MARRAFGMLEVSKQPVYQEDSAYYPTVFNQLFNFIPRHVLERTSQQLGGDRYVKGFTSWRQFPVLLYAQVSGKQSLREIESGLLTQQAKLYHLGWQTVRRSTLADAMVRRDAAIYEALFYAILDRATQLAPRHRFRFKNPLHSMDVTTIDLCLSVFNWAKFRTTKGAIKRHCQLDHRGHIPSFISMSDGKTHEITVAGEQMELIPESIYCFDMAYIDFAWLQSLDKRGVFFVTRAKDNLAFRGTGQYWGNMTTMSMAIQPIGCPATLRFETASRPEKLEIRTWTVHGKTFKGALLGLDYGAVKIRLKKGGAKTLPVAELFPDDQFYVKARLED